MAKTGVVTVTYNSGKVLDDFMQSILKQNHKDFILYVIDNDSKDNTLEILAKYSDDRIKLIANKDNYGCAKGNNQGIIESLIDNCDYVLLLNNDTVFDENLLTILLRDLQQNLSDMVAPKMMYYEPNNKIWCAGGGFNKWLGVKAYQIGEKQIDKEQYNFVQKCDYVPTCCALIKSELFLSNSVGLMDEKYFVYSDDTDWMWRAKLCNKKLFYTPNTKIMHKVSSLTGVGSEFSIRMYTQNRIYFIRKNIRGVLKYYSLFYVIFTVLLKLFINKIPWRYRTIVIKAIIIGFKYDTSITKFHNEMVDQE